VARLAPEIRAAAQAFVLLRPGNMRGLDLAIFDFDYDLSWCALFLTPGGEVLGRFGGRDAETPAKYQSLPGLRYSLEAALRRFKTTQSPSASEGQKPTKPRRVEDYPAAAKRHAQACIHCHHVYEFRREMLQSEGRWSLDEVWVYPLPENIGVTLEVHEQTRIAAVQPNSPAAKAGLRAKDRLLRINETPIASVLDVQHALHRAPRKDTLRLTWQNGAGERTAALTLPANWRQTDVSWRWSLKSMSPSPGVIGEDLEPALRKPLGLAPGQLAYRQMNFLPVPARHAGLRANDVIIGIDDQPLLMNARQFETHIRLHYRVGQEITLNVVRGKERLKLRLKLPE
jgi:hypothetical protein